MIAVEQAATVAQLKARTQESLWEFLSALPASMEAQIMYGLILSGALGAIASYVYKWANGQVDVCAGDYFFKSNFRRSVLAAIAFFTTIFSGTALGAFQNDGQFVGWLNVLWVGVTTGFSIDVGVNKSARTAMNTRATDKEPAA